MSDWERVVQVAAEVTSAIAAAAALAHPRETGGILLGWWFEGCVIVRHAIEVPDPDATPAAWARDPATAQLALQEALSNQGHPWLGYVGDWHSHPAACGASGQDIASIQHASAQYDQPLVLLVHRADGLAEAIVTASANHPLIRGLISGSPSSGTT